MKTHGGGGGGTSPAKWRWRLCFAVAAAALLFFSLLVPVFVLLGLHNIFPYGFFKENQLSQSDTSFGLFETNASQFQSNNSRNNELVKKLATTFVEDWNENITRKLEVPSKEHLNLNSTGNAICQLEFGSYCIWSAQNKYTMKDSTLKRMKDQLFLARSYFPTVYKQKDQAKFSIEMKQNIQDHEKILTSSYSDSDLPDSVWEKIERMDDTIEKAKLCNVDCNNINKKLRQILDLTENEAYFHMKQSTFLYKLAVQTLPKSHHCLTMRLTFQYFNYFEEGPLSDDIQNPNLKHYVLFSRNVVSASVTVNSTVMNCQDSEDIIFHIVTDSQNFYAFKSWFSRNKYKNTGFQILDFEKFRNLNSYGDFSTQKLFPSEEFQVSFHTKNQETKTEYLSLFGHSHFALPDLFPYLKKVVVLDDDVAVQKDLSILWDFDLGEKLIGAAQFCGVKLGQIKPYLAEYKYDNDSCAWMSGINIINLEKWRELDINAIYHGLVQKFERENEESYRTASLQLSLLVFQDLVKPFPTGWIQSNLGQNYEITHGRIRKALALHFNGNMKPWLDLGIHKYKKYWRKYFPRDDLFMVECNVNP
ncbi:hypothetical protein LUZ60_011062 [Juncus effusus]|nr:hypothetical protein LUZ60_011062 [Juncus effusus]